MCVEDGLVPWPSDQLDATQCGLQVSEQSLCGVVAACHDKVLLCLPNAGGFGLGLLVQDSLQSGLQGGFLQSGRRRENLGIVTHTFECLQAERLCRLAPRLGDVHCQHAVGLQLQGRLGICSAGSGRRSWLIWEGLELQETLGFATLTGCYFNQLLPMIGT